MKRAGFCRHLAWWRPTLFPPSGSLANGPPQRTAKGRKLIRNSTAPREKLMRPFLLTPLLVLAALPAPAAERWETLPPTPAPIASDRSGQAQVNGISIHYAIYGQGSPVIFLHGGLANTDYWGSQDPAVAAHHTVILMDSRGHGH